ncbi:LysR substrate-binding domain-containing protein, partial [Burkholderia glumae]
YGPAAIVTAAARERFPGNLATLPVLLPTAQSPLRAQLERSFEALGVRPRIVGEFEDSALMAVFGARGLGVFPLAEAGAGDAALLRGLRRLGRAQGVVDEIYAIRSRRGEHHPLAGKLRRPPA